MYDRQAEPVSLGIPFPPGVLSDASAFGIRNNGVAIPVQTDVTAGWSDNSVEWLMAHFEADLPGNRAHELEFAHDGSIANPAPERPVVVTETADGIEIDTGVMRVACARENFDLFRRVTLNGKDAFGPGAFSGVSLVDAAGNRFTTSNIARIDVLERGPVRSLVELSGTHTGETGSLFDFRIMIEAWAGKPFVRLEYQFINREDAESVGLSEISLNIDSPPSGDVRCALAEGNYGTRVSNGPGEMVVNAESIIYQGVEHVPEVFFGDFWADWCDGERGVCVTPFQAHQNFPKSLSVHESGIHVGVLPAGEGPIEVLRGVAKTHRMQFLFHGPNVSLDDLVVQSLQFQYPDVGIVPEDWYRETRVWEDLFPVNKSERVERHIIDTADDRNRGLGMMHWGDGPDHGYTRQGRGKGELVWTNNEYDFPHAMFLLYAKTGERRFRDTGLVAAQHWVDVDFCHKSDDPLEMGGQRIHTAGHVTGGVTPSHEWTEGLLDYYHMTGKREALEKAVSIADNMIRHLESPKFRDGGEFAARETGWAMRGFIAVYTETRDPRYLDACRAIADQFIEWRRKWGGLLAPYTSHSRVRVPFMISIAVNALYRYYAVSGDERVPSLIVDEMRDALEHCVKPDGRFFYKELPSLHRRAGGPREMEALCRAYELSGDERFLDQASSMMDSMLSNRSGGLGGTVKSIIRDRVGDTVLLDGPGPKVFGAFYVPFVSAYKTLSDAGVLRDVKPTKNNGARE